MPGCFNTHTCTHTTCVSLCVCVCFICRPKMGLAALQNRVSRRNAKCIARKNWKSARGIVAQLFLPLSDNVLSITHMSLYVCALCCHGKILCCGGFRCSWGNPNFCSIFRGLKFCAPNLNLKLSARTGKSGRD